MPIAFILLSVSLCLAAEKKPAEPREIIKNILTREELGDGNCNQAIQKANEEKDKKKRDLKKVGVAEYCAKENTALEKLAKDAQKKLAGPLFLVARAFELAAAAWSEAHKKTSACLKLTGDKYDECLTAAGSAHHQGMEYRKIGIMIYGYYKPKK
ncbi:MAG: hypothetical protein AAB731_02520 [Patescibacteria group bacterium]